MAVHGVSFWVINSLSKLQANLADRSWMNVGLLYPIIRYELQNDSTIVECIEGLSFLDDS